MKSKSRIWRYPFLIMGVILILANKCEKDEEPEEIKDSDGNIYTSVTIGTQVWMVENLKTTKYNDNTAIPLVTDNTAWGNLSTPGYCWNDNEVANKNPYGALYNWYAVNTGKLCPTGWHVSSNDDWVTLTTYLGGTAVAGGKLKEAGTTHWQSPNEGATNESGFTAIPGGARFNIGGTFISVGNDCTLWTSTEYQTDYALVWTLGFNGSNISWYDYFKQFGFSVRCVKDN